MQISAVELALHSPWYAIIPALGVARRAASVLRNGLRRILVTSYAVVATLAVTRRAASIFWQGVRSIRTWYAIVPALGVACRA